MFLKEASWFVSGCADRRRRVGFPPGAPAWAALQLRSLTAAHGLWGGRPSAAAAPRL